MIVQVGNRCGRNRAAQIGGRGAQHAVGVADALGDQRRIVELAGDHHREVVTFVDQVGHALCEREVNRDLGIGFAITRQPRQQIVPAEAGTRVYPQAAAGAPGSAGRFGFGMIDQLENLAAMRDVALARFGHGDAARGAIQQSHPQLGFERRDGA